MNTNQANRFVVISGAFEDASEEDQQAILLGMMALMQSQQQIILALALGQEEPQEPQTWRRR